MAEVETAAAQTSTPSPDNSSGFISKALRILAYPVSAIVTFWTARVNVSDYSYDQLKNLRAFAKVKIDEATGNTESRQAFINRMKDDSPSGADHRKDHNARIRESIANAVYDVETKTKTTTTENVLESMVSERDKMHAFFEQRKKDLGINGIRKEWKIMHRSQKQMTIINTVTIGAVTLGAMLAAANLKVLTGALQRKTDDEDLLPPQR